MRVYWRSREEWHDLTPDPAAPEEELRGLVLNLLRSWRRYSDRECLDFRVGHSPYRHRIRFRDPDLDSQVDFMLSLFFFPDEEHHLAIAVHEVSPLWSQL